MTRGERRLAVLVSFECFALACGARLAPRDEGMDAPIPTDSSSFDQITSKEDAGSRDGGIADGNVRDGVVLGIPGLDANDGFFAPWYSPAAIPDGGCDTPGLVIEFNVNPCCRIPDSPELTHYRCACIDGIWSCQVLWQGAGYCGDSLTENLWRPECDAVGDR